MNCTSGLFLCCCVLTVATSSPVALADAEDKSEESGVGRDIKPSGNESVEAGPPDSHEAMNNREINPPKMRDKRSYEFLMGLVNNNSRFEITKVDPSIKISQDKADNVTASELLLELMVKIAAHPDHWEKVHQLLLKIDKDLQESKKIVDELQSAKVTVGQKPAAEPSPIIVDKKESDKDALMANQWPTFGEDKVTFVNTVPPESYRWQNSHKTTYPKTFAYHRVTGRPLYLNKNPKAYIAVSVIAPKPINTRSNKEDDVSLEKELRQLKPWTHNQNLKNMAQIRSRWVIQTNGSMAP